MRSVDWRLGLSFFILVFSTPVYSQARNTTIVATDSEIGYVGSGWTTSNGHLFTSIAGSFSLDFTGSAVYWWTRKLSNGAIAIVTIDGDTTSIDLSSGMTQNGGAQEGFHFVRQGLDASGSHNFRVEWGGTGSNGVGSFLENWYIAITTGTSVNSSPTSSSGPPPSPSPSTEPSTNSPTTVSSSSQNSPQTTSSESTSIVGSSISSTVTTSTSISVGPSNSTLTLTVISSPLSSFEPHIDRPSLSSLVSPSASGGMTTSAQIHSDSDLAPIIGGAVGGVLGIIIIICLLICLRKRKRDPSSNEMQSATPFFSSRATINGHSTNSLVPQASGKAQLALDGQCHPPRQVLQERNATRPHSGTVTPFQIVSPTWSSSSSSPFGWSRRWKRPRSSTVQNYNPRDTSDPSSISALRHVRHNMFDDSPPAYPS